MRTAARTDREAESPLGKAGRGGEASKPSEARLASLHAKHAVVALALIGAAAFFGKGALASVALGSGMQAVNLFWLERSVQGWLQHAATGQGGSPQRTTLRLLALLASVAAALAVLPLQPVGFLVGISSAVPAVLWYGLASARRSVR